MAKYGLQYISYSLYDIAQTHTPQSIALLTEPQRQRTKSRDGIQSHTNTHVQHSIRKTQSIPHDAVKSSV